MDTKRCMCSTESILYLLYEHTSCTLNKAARRRHDPFDKQRNKYLTRWLLFFTYFTFVVLKIRDISMYIVKDHYIISYIIQRSWNLINILFRFYTKIYLLFSQRHIKRFSDPKVTTKPVSFVVECILPYQERIKCHAYTSVSYICRSKTVL